MKKRPYIKVASYEVKENTIGEVLLLYSGGLDTSCMLTWIQENYHAKVTTLTLDIGQQKDNLEEIRQKALKFGAYKAIVLDIKDEFAKEYLAKGIKANASYQGDYHLSTPMGRAICSQKAVEVAHQEGIGCIAHGCTGKGNDQVRFEGYILSHDPTLKIIAPVREWDMDRNEEIKYAKSKGIPIPASINSPYSDDDNMWGMTWEGGEIEDPAQISPVEKFLTTYTLAKNAPDKEELVMVDFEKGIPVGVNGKKLSLAKAIQVLNVLGGSHGVGVTHLVEDRLVGLKSGGVYEQPGAHLIIEAHKALEKYVSTRTLNELKQMLDVRWSYLCYGALWHDPTMTALNAFNDSVNELVTGKVTLQLFKGMVTVVAMSSPFALSHSSFNANEGYNFNVNASAGFIEIHSLQMKIANQVRKKGVE
jgi:argininosuccinate synthase